MKYRFAILIITAIILHSCKKSQNNPDPNNGDAKEQWQFFNTTNSKLPDNQVNAIAVSKNGIKWIGTANGLLSINGDAWVVYKAQNDGLPSSNILSLAVQTNGSVWVGTDKGLAKFDGNTWTSYDLTNSILPDRGIMSLVCDEKYNRVWVGTSKGIVEIDSNNNWILHGETEDILPLSMTVDQTGALWIGAHDPFNFRGSIKKFQNGDWKSYALDQMGYESAFPYAIAVDKDNAVVAVLAGTATRAVIKFTNSTWTELTLPQNARGMRTMAIEQNTIWTGGVEFMRLNNVGSSTLANPAAYSTILSVGIDAHGYKWLGTINNGLMVYHE